jgi:hypothetical protein
VSHVLFLWGDVLSVLYLSALSTTILEIFADSFFVSSILKKGYDFDIHHIT